jgi:hypothetical protein
MYSSSSLIDTNDNENEAATNSGLLCDYQGSSNNIYQEQNQGQQHDLAINNFNHHSDDLIAINTNIPPLNNYTHLLSNTPLSSGSGSSATSGGYDLLQLNQYSPSPPNSYPNTIKQQQQQQQQQQKYKQSSTTSYIKTRPQPINEKSIVETMVGYFHDVVGTEQSHHSYHNQSNGPLSHHKNNSNNNISSPYEIKDQIEWLHFENYDILDSNGTCKSNQLKANNLTNNILILLGYKTGFSVWTIDLNGVASEVLSIKEPNITRAKLLRIENNSNDKALIAVCKSVVNFETTSTNNNTPIVTSLNASTAAPLLTTTKNDSMASSTSSSSSFSNEQRPTASLQQKNQINIINLLTGECLHEIIFNGNVLDIKSNSNILCVSTWNRIDAFDLVYFKHKFSINSCYSQISKSTGRRTNPFALGSRWLAFADNKVSLFL